MKDSILMRIKTEHNFILDLLRLVGKSGEDLRRELYVNARDELIKNMRGEEKVFRRIKDILADSHTEIETEWLERQHGIIREYLQKLNLLDSDDPKWLGVLEKLSEIVLTHAKWEENILFEEVKEEYSGDELNHLMEEYEEGRNQNPN